MRQIRGTVITIELLVLVFTCIASNGWAKSAPKLSSHEIKAREVLRLQYEPTFDELAKQPALGKPNLKTLKQFQGEAIGALAKIWANYFTDEELDELLRFYSSPVGHKLTLMPAELAKHPEWLAPVFSEMVESLPKDVAMRTHMDDCKTLDGVVGAVRTGVSMYKANDMVENGAPGRYPTKLDSARNGQASTTNIFFKMVLTDGITSIRWTKNGNTYTFSCGQEKETFVYDSKTGNFDSSRRDADKVISAEEFSENDSNNKAKPPALTVRNFHFAVNDPDTRRTPPNYKSGETVYLVFEIKGYTSKARKVWLQEDLMVQYPDGSIGLKQENVVNYHQIVKPGGGPIELTNNIALPSKATPGAYVVTITLRDMLANKYAVVEKQSFTVKK